MQRSEQTIASPPTLKVLLIFAVSLIHFFPLGLIFERTLGYSELAVRSSAIGLLLGFAGCFLFRDSRCFEQKIELPFVWVLMLMIGILNANSVAFIWNYSFSDQSERLLVGKVLQLRSRPNRGQIPKLQVAGLPDGFLPLPGELHGRIQPWDRLQLKVRTGKLGYPVLLSTNGVKLR